MGGTVGGLGLPGPTSGQAWVVSTSGHLTQLAEAVLAGGGWLEACTADPYPFHGWLFLSDPSEEIPAQAMRFAFGRCQWTVPIGSDGRARAPRNLAEAGPGRTTDDRQHALLAACRILPSDYTDYGGDIVRWEKACGACSDCSSGCRWFEPLHDLRTGGSDCDWGVCANPRSARCGMLTWEHQAGHGCFEPAPDPC
jgi:hypothetical protein